MDLVLDVDRLPSFICSSHETIVLRGSGGCKALKLQLAVTADPQFPRGGVLHRTAAGAATKAPGFDGGRVVGLPGDAAWLGTGREPGRYSGADATAEEGAERDGKEKGVWVAESGHHVNQCRQCASTDVS